MAEEEKVGIAENADVVVGSESKRAKAPARRKPARRKIAHKAKAQREAKHEGEGKVVRHAAHKAKSEVAGVSLETLLGVFLAVSLLLNFYLFFQAGSLRGEVENLKGIIASGGKGSGATATTIPTATTMKYSGEKVKLEFYVMSQCPYGTQVMDAIAPVLKQLGGALDFSINYIATDNGDGTFTSLHGQNEVLGDIVELCAMKYEPVKYMDMIVCMDQSASSIPSSWESCAGKASMNVQAVKACYEGAEGKSLLSSSILKSDAVQASGSPTIILKGARYSGARGTSDFLRAVCNAFQAKPDACKNLPEPAKVNVIALNDNKCGADCDISGLISQLKSLFPGMVLKELDYNSAEGKALFEKSNLTALPAILFDNTAQKGEGYSSVSRYLEPAGDYQNLRIGANWDPYCDATQDHCSESRCSGRISCRAEVPAKLDVFIMSQCPYGIMAVDAMKEVLNAFKGKINFGIYYIASETTPGVFNSLHGQGEVDEDLREVCAMKYYPDSYKYLDYIWCRNKDISNSAWESCATGSGMDAAKIKACAEGTEGKQLLSANIKVAQQLSIGGSPTFLVNNKKTFNAIDAAGIQTGFCGVNSGVSGCEKVLNSTTASGASSAGGSCG